MTDSNPTPKATRADPPSVDQKTKPKAKKNAPAQIAKRKSHQRQIDPRIRHAIELMSEAALNGQRMTITDAAKTVGMSKEGLSKALKRPEISALAQAQVRRLLGGAGLIKAGMKLVELVDAESEYVAADVSKHLLAIGGIRPQELGAGQAGNLGITLNIGLTHVQSGAISVQPRAQIAQPIEAQPIPDAARDVDKVAIEKGDGQAGGEGPGGRR